MLAQVMVVADFLGSIAIDSQNSLYGAHGGQVVVMLVQAFTIVMEHSLRLFQVIITTNI